MDVWIDVGDAAGVRGMREMEAGGYALLLLEVGGVIHAVSAICPHHHAWLSMGRVEGGAIDCPRHQGRFDIATGAQLRGPACPALPVYAVRVQDGRVLVALPLRR